MNNFLPLDRKILNHWLWEDKPFSKGQAWIDLLMLANYKDKKKPIKDTVITYKRGDVNLSIVQLADRWGWDRRKVKRFLDVLSDDGMVSVDSTTYGTTITIVNYGTFNNVCTANGTTYGTTNVQPIVQPEHTTNKDNKDKKDEESKNEITQYNTPPISPSYNRVETNKPKRESYKQLFDRILPQYEISEYLLTAVRKWLKYKYYEHHFEYGNDSLNDLLEQVSKKSMEYGDETVCTAISESIANGYQGIVWNKIKTEKTTGYQNKTAEMLQNGYEMIADWARKKEMEEQDNDN